MNTKLKDKLYNITFTINDLNHKPIPKLYYEIKNGSDLVKKNKTNDKGEIHLKYVGGNTLTIFVKKDKDNKLKKISEIHTPSKNIKVKLISPQMKFDVTLLPHEENGAYWKGTYKVQSGDTLSKIAKDHHTTVSALLALNPNIKLPNKISINEYIEIGEANADALVKLDKNTTVKVPPVKETGNVAVDRKSKSSSVIDLTTEIKKMDTANNQQQISEPKNSNTNLPSSSQTKNSPEGEPQKEIVQPEKSTVVTQKIEVQQEHNEDKKPVAVASLNECVCKDYDLIWGAKVNCAFRKKVVEISKELWGDSKKIEKANMLMAVFAWESGGTFATDVPNMNNSGGTGLIQIMPDTYKYLTKKEPKIIKTKKYFNKELNVIEELKNMTPLEYLDIVKQYFLPLKDKDIAFIDFYLQVLFPASANREEHTVFAKNKNLLDVNDHVNKRVDKFERNNMDGWYIGEKGKLHKDGEKDGKVMKSEIAAAVEHYQTDGLSYKSEYKDGCSIKLNNTSQSHDCILGQVVNGFIIDNKIKIHKVPSYNKLSLNKVKAIVLHRTAGGPSVKTYLDSIMKSESTVGVQFWIGKDGVIYQAGGLDKLSHHIDKAPLSNPKIPDLWSKYAVGIEVSGYYFNPNGQKVVGNIKTDPKGKWEEVSDAQAKSVACLVSYLLKYFNLSLPDVTVHEKQCSKTHDEGQNVYDAMIPYLNEHGY